MINIRMPNMRALIDIVENNLSAHFPNIDREKIIARMLASVRGGTHWDEYRPNIVNCDGAMMQDDWDIDDEQFEDHLKQWGDARFNKVAQKLSQIPSVAGKYLVHRVIRVPQDWADDVVKRGGSNLGVFWTFDIKNWDINAPWAEIEGHDVLIEAHVASEHVDWTHTFLANMDWSQGDEEHELRLQRGAPVQVASIEDMQKRPVMDISGLTFTA